MVEFTILYPKDIEYRNLLSQQRIAIAKLLDKGDLISYSINHSITHVWGIFVVNNESHLVSILDKLPLNDFMDYQYEELMFHNSIHMIPSSSLN
jgi:muconolactone delta-isomerase